MCYLFIDNVFPSLTFPKMCVFINMVITQAKNGSQNMILMAFDGKFNEKKDEMKGISKGF